VVRRRELTTAGSPRIFSDPAGSCLWTTLRKGGRTRGREARDRRQESPIADAQKPPAKVVLCKWVATKWLLISATGGYSHRNTHSGR
jgi:hypothetical protein